MKEFRKASINEAAEEAIKIIREISDPFCAPVMVFHNSKAAQWFKAYYLKHKTDVMMNVGFVTLSVWINDLLNPDGTYTIISKAELKNYIISVLLDKNEYRLSPGRDQPLDFIFTDDGSINGINLFELSGRLAELFIGYENDLAPITGWEADLYKKTMQAAERDNCFTSGSLYASRGISGKCVSPVAVINNSYMTPLYREIIGKCENVTLFTVEPTEDAEKKTIRKVISAPSLLREVEAVHSEICKIIAGDPDVRYGDFLVYAPNINEYATSIRRVFIQDNVSFPSVPFRLIGDNKERRDMADSLMLLGDIARKRYFTRNDFYRFVCNPVIQKVHNISGDDVKVWMNVIAATNTHRSGKQQDIWPDDWSYLKSRLLSAVLVADNSETESSARIGDETVLPYYSMELESEVLNRILDVINLLRSWSALFPDMPGKLPLEAEKAEAVRAVLDTVYSVRDADGAERNRVYRSVGEMADQIIGLLKKDNKEIPADTFLMLLQSAPERYVINPADMFSGGVTFLSLNCDDIFSADYVFVMGMSSEKFPRVDIPDELDISSGHISNLELDGRAVGNLLSGSGSITFSYVNRDLQKDEQKFPSPLIPADARTEIIPIDENRPYGELFTGKAFKGKEDFARLSGNASADQADTSEPAFSRAAVGTAEKAEDPVFSTSEIRKYIKNTFIYRFERVMKAQKDHFAEAKNEYETIDVDGLSKYDAVKKMVISGLESNADMCKILQCEQKIPSAVFGKAYYDTLCKMAAIICGEIKKRAYQLVRLEPLRMIWGTGSSEEKWTLNCSVELFRAEDTSGSPKKLFYVDPGPYDPKDGVGHYLNMYLFSLMDVAGREGGEYEISLWNKKNKRVYTLAPDKAKDILNGFYSQVRNTAGIRYMDLEFIAEMEKPEEPKRGPDTMEKLLSRISNHNEWKYFADSVLVDPYSEFGYGSGDISGDFEENEHSVAALIRYLFEANKQQEEQPE